jgi:hypothetical protein
VSAVLSKAFKDAAGNAESQEPKRLVVKTLLKCPLLTSFKNVTFSVFWFFAHLSAFILPAFSSDNLVCEEVQHPGQQFLVIAGSTNHRVLILLSFGTIRASALNAFRPTPSGCSRFQAACLIEAS